MILNSLQNRIELLTKLWLIQPHMCQHPAMSPKNSPCADYPLTVEQQAAIYGYMDDHKKNMIQQWVECQSRIQQVNGSPMRVPPQHPMIGAPHPGVPQFMPQPPPQVLQGPPPLKQKQQREPVPFAWLNNPDNHENENGQKMLTQFKTADSSEDSFSDDQIDYRCVVTNTFFIYP